MGEKKRTGEGRLKRAMYVSGVSLAWNAGLGAFKLFAGILGGSQAMIADAVHSASDVFTTLVVMAGVKLSAKTSDQGHPYGHERLECAASVLLACCLFATGLALGLGGMKEIFSGNVGRRETPGVLPMAAAVISILVKEWMYRYAKEASVETGFCSLLADAWHHRSDALSSVGALFGIAGARAGVLLLDPLAAVIISIFIGKAAVDVFLSAMDQMVDKACGVDVVDRMEKTACDVEGVRRVDELRTRRFGPRVYVDIEIAADGELPLYEAHEIAEEVHLTVEEYFPEVKHCMVHVNPWKKKEV